MLALIISIIFGATIALILYNYREQLFISDKEPPPLAAMSNSGEQKVDVLDYTLLDDESIKRSKQKAIVNLLALWGIPIKERENFDICKFAENINLRCFDKNISFKELIKLNRPAILKVSDDKGKEFYVTLMHVSDDIAELRIVDEVKAVDLKELEKKWLGEYILLWEPPPGFEGYIYPGYKGPFVEWIGEKIYFIQGKSLKRSKYLKYEGEIVKQIKQFQSENGLKADGIVGPLTVIHMNNSLGSGEPKLMQKEKNFVSIERRS